MSPDDRARLLSLAGQYAYDDETGHGEATGAAGALAGFVDSLIAARQKLCASACLKKVTRQPGYNGQWEGYGAMQDDMTGPECAAAIESIGQ